MKIKITEFAERHFDKDFGGTKILDFSVEEFEEKINKETYSISEIKKHKFYEFEDDSDEYVKLMDGYAPFCKLLAIKNFTKAKVGSMPITLENYQYLRSGYSARREGELPVFSRWLELPLGKPTAEWLILVLYDREQINKEANLEELKKIHYSDYETEKEKYELLDELDCFSDNFEDWCDENNYSGTFSFSADWGVVAILGQSHSNEEPMKPETMLRNALGIEEGGSGVKLDREKYLESVEFWSNNATIK
jgi:hypothetical protein